MHKESYLFIDIETVAPPLSGPLADARAVLDNTAAAVQVMLAEDAKVKDAAKLWETSDATDAATMLSKAYKMRATKPGSVYDAIQTDDPHARMALDKNYAQVCCVSFAIGDEEPETILCHNAEGEAVESTLIKLLETSLPVELGAHVWVGHNITGFDLPILYRRAIKYSANRLAFGIPSKRYDKHYRDTMTMWGGTDWTDKTKLDTIADVLGIERNVNGVDGSQVAGMWARREYGDIERYCADDVKLTRDVFWRLTDGGVHA